MTSIRRHSCVFVLACTHRSDDGKYYDARYQADGTANQQSRDYA